MAATTNRRAAHASVSPAPTMGWAHALVAMSRPSQIALILAVLAAGVLLGLTRPSSSLGTAALVATIIVVGVSIAAHLVNEAADAETDRRTQRTAFSGGSGALAASGLTPAVPLAVGLGAAIATAAMTLVAWASATVPASAAVILLAGLVGGLAYSLPPVAAMRRGWGEPLNALLGGLLLPLAGVAAVVGSVSLEDALAFLPFSFVTMASVLATAWPDRAADAATGKRTLTVRLAPSALRRLQALAVAAFVAATLLSQLTGAMPLALAGLLVLPLLLLGLARFTRFGSALPNVAAMVGLIALTDIILSITVGAGA